MRGRKRSLSQTGGPCQFAGDPGMARILAHCLAVAPDAKLPFTHGFHAYPARMHPETARRAIEAFLPGGGAVFDPFVGSGTAALEAVRRGLRFIGSDLSRVALEIAWVRTRVMPPEACRGIEKVGHRLAGRGLAGCSNPLAPWPEDEIQWYSPHTLHEIRSLKGLIDAEAEPNLRRILTCVLSSILVKLSKQASESVVKVDRQFRARPPGTTFRWFRDKCTELTRMLLQLSSDLYKRKVRYHEPEVVRADARSFRPPAAVDLVLTSPPYAGTYDYTDHQARRLPLFDSPALPDGAEIGSRREGGRGYREDMEACLRNTFASLAPQGRIVMLIGDGRIGEKPLRADALIRELSTKVGARFLAAASQKRRDRIGKSQRREHLLLLGKPETTSPASGIH